MKELLKLLPILGLALGSLNCGAPADEGPEEPPEGTEEAEALGGIEPGGGGEEPGGGEEAP